MTVTCYAFNCSRRNERFGNCFSMFAFLIFLLFSSVLVDAAPHKSKSKKNDGPQMVLDQKQTGDYNIQLHLKNFQIIAMLGDDMLGDYDYNYDYADFTIKPSGSTSTSTTPKPPPITLPPSTPPSTTQKATSHSTNQPPSSSSEQNIVPSDLMIADDETSSPTKNHSSFIVSNTHPYPLEVIVPQPPKKPEDQPQVLQIKEVLNSPYSSSNGPAVEDNTSQDVTLETILNLVSSSRPSSPSPSISSFPSKPLSSTLFSLPIPSPSPESPPGKIKVEILGGAISTKAGIPSEGIVPGEEVQGDANGSVLHSELASYRKCSTGYSRDKRGRCRRVRRPGLSSQLPFGLTRLASNLATRLRLTPNENPAVTSISTES